ncbi:MAG TPA: glycosyltransferase family 9 protein [Gemmatimonadaceae bacterium]
MDAGSPFDGVRDRVADVREIAVLRANRIGDFLFALPAIDALRAAYPDARITLLGSRIHEQLLASRPSPIDRVIVLPPAEGVNVTDGPPVHEDALERFFDAMRREAFDLALQLHGGGRYSNPFTRRLGARVTVGLKADDAEPLDRSAPYVYFQSEISRALDVVALVGAEPVTLEPRLTVTVRDRADAARLVPVDGSPLALLHPGASDPRREWPPEHFAAAGDAMAEAGLQVAVTGLSSERGTVERVIGRMRAPAIDLCGRTTLGALLGLAERARVVISNDSGPLHAATAVGAPTVGIYWCGNLITGAPLTRARHRPLISWRLDCAVCGTNCMTSWCDHTATFVGEVRPEEVIAAAKDLLAASSAAPAASLTAR